MSSTPTMTVNALTRFGDVPFQMMEIPRPTAGKGQVVIRNYAAGVNNVDTMIRRGALPPEATPLPHVLGVEGAGVVDAVGSSVEDLKVGERVMWFGTLGSGGYGQFTVIDAQYVAAIGASVSFQAAAATPVAYATAHHMLFDYGRPKPGSWVLVRSAAGGVGAAALQLARNAGLQAIAVADGEKLAFAKANGAVAAFDYKQGALVDRVLELTEGRGVDLALNSVAGPTVEEDLKMLAPFGQVISFGHLAGLPTGSAADLLMPYFNKSVGIRVSDIYSYYTGDPQGLSATLRAIAGDLQAGRIEPQVFAVEPLAKAAEAHAHLESSAVRGKVVIGID